MMNQNMIMRSPETLSNSADIDIKAGTQSTSESTVSLLRGTAWLPEEPEKPEEDKQARSLQSRRMSLRLTLAGIVAGGLLMFGSVVWMAVTEQGGKPVSGPLVADHNTHQIESVQADMRAPTARFLLRAYGAPLVTEVTTDLQCASARLVQGGQSSQWFGFSHPSEQFAGVQMLPYQPAYLEVRIDPAIHGLDGDEPLSHSVLLKTEDGQALSFEVATGGK